MPKNPLNFGLTEIMKLLTTAAIVSTIGGFAALIITIIFPADFTNWTSILFGILLLLITIMVYKYAYKGIDFFEFMLLLVAVALVNAIITLFFPMAAPFLLSASSGTSPLSWLSVILLTGIGLQLKKMVFK